MLARVKGRIVHMVLSRVSPLAVPVLLEIGRESVRVATQDEERLLAEAEAIIAEATGEQAPTPVAATRRARKVARATRRCRRRCSGDDRGAHPSRRRAPDARPGRCAVLAGHRPAGGLRPASGEGLVLCAPRPAAAALGHPRDAGPPHRCCCAATGRASSSRWATASTTPTAPPACRRRTRAPARHDRGASLHLGAGQPRSLAAAAASAASGWRNSPPTTLTFRHQAHARRGEARSPAITTPRPPSRRAAAASAAPASWPTRGA